MISCSHHSPAQAWTILYKCCHLLSCSHNLPPRSGTPADLVLLKLGWQRKWWEVKHPNQTQETRLNCHTHEFVSAEKKAQWPKLKSEEVKWCRVSITVCYGLTPSSPGAPASSPAHRAHSEGLSVVQADGLDVVGQGGQGCQTQHCYIRPSDVAQSDICYIQCHFKGVRSILLRTTQNDSPFRRYGRTGRSNKLN